MLCKWFNCTFLWLSSTVEYVFLSKLAFEDAKNLVAINKGSILMLEISEARYNSGILLLFRKRSFRANSYATVELSNRFVWDISDNIYWNFELFIQIFKTHWASEIFNILGIGHGNLHTFCSYLYLLRKHIYEKWLYSIGLCTWIRMLQFIGSIGDPMDIDWWASPNWGMPFSSFSESSSMFELTELLIVAQKISCSTPAQICSKIGWHTIFRIWYRFFLISPKTNHNIFRLEENLAV